MQDRIGGTQTPENATGEVNQTERNLTMELRPSIVSALAAYNPNNYSEYDDNVIASRCKNAERALIEKDNFEKMLSPQAKYMIRVICQEPDELFAQKKSRIITWTRIREYMVSHCNLKWKEVYKARKEISAWLRESL